MPIPSHLAVVHLADLLPPIETKTTPLSFPPLRGEFARLRAIYPQKSERPSRGASALLPFCSAAPSPRPRRGVTSPNAPASTPKPPRLRTCVSPSPLCALLHSRHFGFGHGRRAQVLAPCFAACLTPRALLHTRNGVPPWNIPASTPVKFALSGAFPPRCVGLYLLF